MSNKTMEASIYRSGTWTNEWRWRLLDGSNKKILGASTEAYSRRGLAIRNFERVTGVTMPLPLVRGATLYRFTVFR